MGTHPPPGPALQTAMNEVGPVQVLPYQTHVESAWNWALETKIRQSAFKICFHFSLRRHKKAVIREAPRATRTDFPLSVLQAGAYTGLHSSTLQLDLSCFCH
jgi:hypothetical protein